MTSLRTNYGEIKFAKYYKTQLQKRLKKIKINK